MRPLVALPAELGAVLPVLRAALSGDGPAVLPLAPGATADGVPGEVLRRVALVVQTSGSAGAPKRVALSSDALLASAAATEGALGGPGRWILALPVHYIAGLQVLTRSITAGADPIALPPGPFDPGAFAAAVREVPAPVLAYTSLVPAQLASALADPEGRRALARLDGILVGGQRLPDAVRNEAIAAGARVVRTYGSTETSGGCVYDGMPLTGVDVRIVDGEVQLAGPMLAEEYLGDPPRTERAFPVERGQRWYRTGDAGSIDDGRLRVTGRIDDVLISGGEKVSLARVESIVRELPGCADAVVVAADSARWGQVPVVVWAGRTGAAPALEALRAAVGDRLGAAARPDRIVRVDGLPLLSSGKPDRRALAAAVADASAP
ncbi:MAG: o-succinylbenzoate--CoA ligase [Naasia sp.]|nr:o-succinylbenzoate--CoA ligase [Naasia sp.]